MIFKKNLSLVIFIFVILLSFSNVKGDWWNSSWNSKRQLNITENSGNDLTAYPVSFWLNHNGNANADCSDIRIVNETQGSVVDDIALGNCNSTHVEVLFRPNLTASSTVTDYYVYYDNPSASVINQSWNTVLFNKDDVEDGDIDEWRGNTGNFTASTDYAWSGSYSIKRTSTGSGAWIDYGQFYTRSHYDYLNLSMWLRLDNGVDMVWANESNVGYTTLLYNGDLKVDERPWQTVGCKVTDIVSSGNWYRLEMNIYSGGTIHGYVYDSSNNLINDCSFSDSGWQTEGVFNIKSYDNNNHFDDMSIRPYATFEPSISVGSEESANRPPTYSNFNIENPTNYPGITNVSIDWADADGNFEYSILETNITGFPVNETGNVTSKSIVLGVGIFYAKFYGNDIQEAWNSTNRKNFTINKALASLLINKNITSPITYPESVKTIGSNCPSQLTCSLYRNGSPVNNPDEVLLGAGNYKWSFNTSGNKNYTQDEVITKLAINKGIPSLSILFNKTSPIIYPTPLKTTAFERNQGDSDLTYILERNGTLIERGSNVSDETLLKPGVYNYTYYTKGGNNWTSKQIERILVVKKGKKLEKEKINFLEKSLTSGRHIIKILRKIGEEIKKIFIAEKIGLEKRTPNYSFKTYTYNNFTIKKLRGEGIELELRESSDKKEINFKCPEGIYVRKIIKGNIKERIKGNSRKVRLKFERAMNILKEKLSKLE